MMSPSLTSQYYTGFAKPSTPPVPRSSSLDQTINAKENNNAPAGFEFTNRSLTPTTTNTTQDNGASSAIQPQSSFLNSSSKDPTQSGTDSAVAIGALDQSLRLKDVFPTTQNATNLKPDDLNTTNRITELTDPKTTADNSDTLIAPPRHHPHHRRSYSNSESISSDKQTEKTPQFGRFKSQSPDGPKEPSPRSASTSRIPRPSLPGATPGTSKPGSITDRMKSFQN